jgi:2-dehydropantoate 2-reductase
VRVGVIGCGAVGSLFAAHLAQLDDVEVWAFDLDRDHVEAINRDGLRLSGVGDLVGRLNARSDPAEIPSCDFGIVAVKSMHTDAAMAAVSGSFEDGAVCSVQNGIGNEEIVARHADRVIRGTTFPAGHVIEPGHVGWDTKGDTWIGPFEPSPAPMESVEQLADALSRSGMSTVALPDARGAQWTKAIFNAATNPVGALTGLAHGEVCDFGPTRRLVTGLADEGKAVAAALGIVLDHDPEEMIDHAARVAHDHNASMTQDVLARRQTEIDFLNGAVVEHGEEAGVPTPLNRAIWALVKALEDSWNETIPA